MTGRSSMCFSNQPGAEFEWFILRCRTWSGAWCYLDPVCCPSGYPHCCRLQWQWFLTDMQWRRMAGVSRACYHMVDLHCCLCCPVHLPIESSHLQSREFLLSPNQRCGAQGSPGGSLRGSELSMKFILLLLLSAPASTLLEEKSSLLRSVSVVIQTQMPVFRLTRACRMQNSH